MKPKKLAIIGGRKVLIDYDSRKEEYKEYNKHRQLYDKELLQFYRSKLWRNTSKTFLLSVDYVCCRCGGQATLTDHIVPVKIAWEKRFDPENFQAMCDSCHQIKTIEDKRQYNI